VSAAAHLASLLPGATWGATPVLLCHGEADDVFPPAEADTTKAALQAMGGTEVQLIEYAYLKHGINLLELKDTALFIAQTRGVQDIKSGGGWLW
jgi:predicted esterase